MVTYANEKKRTILILIQWRWRKNGEKDDGKDSWVVFSLGGNPHWKCWHGKVAKNPMNYAGHQDVGKSIKRLVYLGVFCDWEFLWFFCHPLPNFLAENLCYTIHCAWSKCRAAQWLTLFVWLDHKFFPKCTRLDIFSGMIWCEKLSGLFRCQKLVCFHV